MPQAPLPKNVTFTLSRPEWLELRAQAARRGVAMAELVRGWVVEGLTRQPDDRRGAEDDKA